MLGRVAARARHLRDPVAPRRFSRRRTPSTAPGRRRPSCRCRRRPCPRTGRWKHVRPEPVRREVADRGAPGSSSERRNVGVPTSRPARTRAAPTRSWNGIPLARSASSASTTKPPLQYENARPARELRGVAVEHGEEVLGRRELVHRNRHDVVGERSARRPRRGSRRSPSGARAGARRSRRRAMSGRSSPSIERARGRRARAPVLDEAHDRERRHALHAARDARSACRSAFATPERAVGEAVRLLDDDARRRDRRGRRPRRTPRRRGVELLRKAGTP